MNQFLTAFNPERWATRYAAVYAEERTHNGRRDSGWWTGPDAARHEAEALLLYEELFEQLLLVPLFPADARARPALAAVLAAVHGARAIGGAA